LAAPGLVGLFAFARAALLEFASIAGGDRFARPGQVAIGELTPDLVVAAGDPLERDNQSSWRRALAAAPSPSGSG
jgi:hypothetical protein